METLQFIAMKTTITEIADKIRKDRQAVLDEQLLREQQEFLAIIERLQNEFEIGFKEQISLLNESGIKWSAHLNNDKYEDQGAYILFKKGDKSIKMDFNNRVSYRYEYFPYSLNEYASKGTMVFGDWDKDDFYLFIDEKLLKQF